MADLHTTDQALADRVLRGVEYKTNNNMQIAIAKTDNNLNILASDLSSNELDSLTETIRIWEYNIKHKPQKITVGTIVNMVLTESGLTIPDISRNTKWGKNIKYKQFIALLLKKYCSNSYWEISAFFKSYKGWDRTNLIHHSNRCVNYCAIYPEYKIEYEYFESMLIGKQLLLNPPPNNISNDKA